MADPKSLEEYTPEELASMGQLYAKLAKDPSTRETVLRATKKVAPETSIPEIDVLDRVEKATKPYVDKLTKLEADALEREAERRLERARDSLQKSGHTQDEIDAIEKLMVDEKKAGNFLTHAKAAEFFKLQKQTAEPTTSGIRTVNTLPVDRDALKKAGGIRRWGANEAHSAISDLRAGRVKLH